jgi:thiol-disulfide isomerase/thioredoxin
MIKRNKLLVKSLSLNNNGFSKYKFLLPFILCPIFFWAQRVEVVNFQNLERKMTKKMDTTIIVHFFASWCVPCLKELPEFVNLDNSNQDSKKKLIFISLDLASEKEKVEALVIKYKINSTVYLLNEGNDSNWINNIDKNWSGALPATLIINDKKRTKKLIEGPISVNELEQLNK